MNNFLIENGVARVELLNRTGDVVAHAILDESDVERVLSGNNWSAVFNRKARKRYAMRRVGEKSQYMHRVVMEAAIGQEVDHDNHDGLDNRRSNLKLGSHSDNLFNRRGVSSLNRHSGVRNVGWNDKVKMWTVKISYRKQRYSFGLFKNLADAEAVAKESRARLLAGAV